MNSADIDSIIRRGGPRKRWLFLSAAAAAIIAAIIVAYFLTRSDETDVVVEPERTEAVMGRLSTEVELSGSAVADRSASLSFEVSGVVASVSVALGDDVRTGDPLASLDDTESRLRVETERVQLRLAQLRLDNLLAEPDASAIASAEQALASAQSQVIDAELDFDRLGDPPSASEVASAEQAVASALGQISSAEQELAALSASPSAAERASAEQAVSTALGQLSSAEEALAALSESPSPDALASAQESVASALVQLSSAEQALADLTAGPSEAEISELQVAVSQAAVRLTEAEISAEESMETLTEALDAFCNRYESLGSRAVIRDTCDSPLPLSDVLVEDFKASFEDSSETYESLGASLADANIAFVSSSADRDSAKSALASAEEQLEEQLAPVSAVDLFQAEKSVEAARAFHVAAVARLDELLAPGSEDVFQAQQAVEAAKSSHEAAVASLQELYSPDEEDIYQAQQAVEAAKSSHAAAVARLEELLEGVDEADRRQAQASLETARAVLASAQAQYDELLAGPSENAIEQQRQDVRIAELSLEEALEAAAILTIYAPFDGVIEAVNVQPGDRVAAALSAFTLSTPSRMLVELTVTEEELPELEAEQSGFATFDAIDGIQYPVRVVSVGRVPNAEQGVVTYDVEARILTGPELAEDAPQPAVGGLRPGGGFAGAFSGIELPEGVTPQQIRQAIISGEPIPEGVELPEEVERLLQTARESGALSRFAGGQQGAGQQPPAASARPLPAPGMSASVTIVTEVREEALLLPISAVRQLDGEWFVTVPGPAVDGPESGTERLFVEVGDSDGTSVEITGGLEAGAVVLIGADNVGVAYAATVQQPRAVPGGGPGFFGPGGGGGGR